MSGEGAAAVTEAAEAELRAMTYEGEVLEAIEQVAGGHVAVTSHRVLVLRDGETPRFETIALPNVEAAGVETEGNRAAGLAALRYGLYAIVLFGASLFVDFGGLVNTIQTPDAGGTGASEVVGVALRLVGLLRLVDEVLGLVALGVALLALGHALRYTRSRSQYFEIHVSGTKPVRVTIDRSTQSAADSLARTVEQASNGLGQ